MRFSKRHRDRRPPPSPLPRSASATDPDASLRKKIQEFAFQPRFDKSIDLALGQFFGKEAVHKRQIVADEGETAEFQEWLFNDFRLSSGETILDLFTREIGPQLSPIEGELLAAHRRWNRYRLFEVEKIMPGVGIVATDLLSGETWEIHDRTASRVMQRWSMILARLTYTDRLHFSGAAVVMSPSKKQVVVAHSRQLLADFQSQHPEATLDEFYRQRGLDIRRFMQKKAQERPLTITPEGHAIEHCEARYLVKSAGAVMERLDSAEEFEFAGPSTDRPGANSYTWLLRGRSHVPEQAGPRDRETLVLSTDWISQDDDKIRFSSLGDVFVSQNRLALICASRARLQAGKALLKSLAGDFIRHRGDHFEPYGARTADERPRAPAAHRRRSSRPAPEMEKMDQRIFEETFKIWSDTPVEALGGKTPREAVGDPEGRAKVIDALKIIEYHQTQMRLNGQRWYDVNLIRRDLGLPEI